MISCILLAAGSGTRMKGKENKIFMRLGRYSVLQWNLLHLREVSELQEIIIVVAPNERERVEEEVNQCELSCPVIYTVGGKERQDSVLAGTSKVNKSSSVILVHDGARPMAQKKLFEETAAAAVAYGAAVVAVPATDTIKRVQDNGFVRETLTRSELYCVQTPQGFRKEVLEEAQTYAVKTGYVGTDDVSLVEHLGKPVAIVPGDYKNIKVTTPSDLIAAKNYLGVQTSMMRVGFGYDVHRFKEGRPCILGGVEIESKIGPDGHSDADVLIHALMDALLGAAGLRDIGYYFPPEDDAYKGISSLVLLEKVIHLLKKEGFSAYNIDTMVIAEEPKLKPHIEAMKENMSRIIGIPSSRVSIKATTHEKLGAFGRSEGIAAQAVVSIYEGEVL